MKQTMVKALRILGGIGISLFVAVLVSLISIRGTVVAFDGHGIHLFQDVEYTITFFSNIACAVFAGILSFASAALYSYAESYDNYYSKSYNAKRIVLLILSIITVILSVGTIIYSFPYFASSIFYIDLLMIVFLLIVISISVINVILAFKYRKITDEVMMG